MAVTNIKLKDYNIFILMHMTKNNNFITNCFFVKTIVKQNKYCNIETIAFSLTAIILQLQSVAIIDKSLS